MEILTSFNKDSALSRGRKVMKDTLKIGRIPYANLFPTFYYLDRECDLSRYAFYQGVPSALNRMLRQGELDISPSSSIEYLRNKGMYSLLPWFSVSSSGSIGSILLFSRCPLEDLEGKTIAVSSESETSVALLKIILKEFLSLRSRFRVLESKRGGSALSDYSAVLLIGDKAMKEAKKQSILKEQGNGAGSKAVENMSPDLNVLGSESWPFVYDLGNLWHKYTGLPFVFALWIVRKKAILEKKDIVWQLSLDLISAKKFTHNKLPCIADAASQNRWLAVRELVDYWKAISYDLTDRHLEGLRLFEKYSLKQS